MRPGHEVPEIERIVSEVGFATKTGYVDDPVALSMARSMLIVLIATSEQALAALAAVDHSPAIDAHLNAVIEESRAQLQSFTDPAA